MFTLLTAAPLPPKRCSLVCSALWTLRRHLRSSNASAAKYPAYPHEHARIGFVVNTRDFLAPGLICAIVVGLFWYAESAAQPFEDWKVHNLFLICRWEGMMEVMHRCEFKLVTVVSECYFTCPHKIQQALAV